MSSRVDRYKAAVVLAQIILEEEERYDEFNLQQAIDDVIDEVRAGRRNQKDFAMHARRALELIRDTADGHSRRVPPLRLVEDVAS